MKRPRSAPGREPRFDAGGFGGGVLVLDVKDAASFGCRVPCMKTDNTGIEIERGGVAWRRPFHCTCRSRSSDRVTMRMNGRPLPRGRALRSTR